MRKHSRAVILAASQPLLGGRLDPGARAPQGRYLIPAQKRWMRVQASTSTSSEVA